MAPTAHSTKSNSSAFKESFPLSSSETSPAQSKPNLENSDFLVAQSGLGDFDYAVPLGCHGIRSWKTALRGISSHPLMGQTGNCSLGQGKGHT